MGLLMNKPDHYDPLEHSIEYRLGKMEAHMSTLCKKVGELTDTVKKNNRDIANAVVAVKVAKWFVFAAFAFITFKWTSIKLLWNSL